MSYPGSKAQAGVFHTIIGQQPPHSCYVEPFAGSAQVFHRKRRAERSILIDRNRSCIAKLSAEGLSVNAICADAFKALPLLIATLPADAVIYCDPPYLLSTRAGRRYYEHELTEAQHKQLLGLLCDAGCRVQVSGYPSELYGAALRDWRCIRYRTRTRGRTVTECLWCNYPEPDELHDWRYAGKNYRERLYLKRLAMRWLAKLDGMSPRKEGYVLHAIAQRQARAPALTLPLAAVIAYSGAEGLNGRPYAASATL
jgi:DNA adenine methylase